MRKLLFIVVLVFFVVLLPVSALAEVILDDSFTDLTGVDTTRTTAKVDTSAGEVRLPYKPKPSAIAAMSDGIGYGVVVSGGVEVYQYDGSNMILNTVLTKTIPGAKGIAFTPDGSGYWALTETELRFYGPSGYDATKSVSGLTNTLAVSVWLDEAVPVVLSRSASGTGVITTYMPTGAGLLANPALSFDTLITKPVSISVIPETRDILYATETKVYNYCFLGDQYFRNPSMETGGLEEIQGVAALDGEAYVLIDQDSSPGYSYVGGILGEDAALTVGPVELPMAVANIPGTRDRLIYTRNGEVQYWQYTGADSVRNPNLEVSGLEAGGRYETPKEYQSKTVVTAQNYTDVRLTVDQTLPAGTLINYFVNSDGGATWTAVIPGNWVTIPEGNKFAVRATLSTTDPNVTPKILRVILEVTALEITKVEGTNITLPLPAQPIPTTSFPIFARAGTEVTFEITTRGMADAVAVTISSGDVIIPVPQNPITNDINIWRGAYVIPLKIGGDYVEDGQVFNAVITAQRDGRQAQKVIAPFIIVLGKATDVLELQLVQ